MSPARMHHAQDTVFTSGDGGIMMADLPGNIAQLLWKKCRFRSSHDCALYRCGNGFVKSKEDFGQVHRAWRVRSACSMASVWPLVLDSRDSSVESSFSTYCKALFLVSSIALLTPTSH